MSEVPPEITSIASAVQKHGHSKIVLDAAMFFGTLKLTPIELPEIDTPDGSMAVVYGKPLSGKAALELGRSKDDGTDMDTRLSRVVGQSIFREDGTRFFTDEQAEQLAELVSAPVFNRLAAGVGAINKVEKKEGGDNTDSDPNSAPPEPLEKKD